MPRARVEERVGRCTRLGAGFLTGWRLAFHKRSTDGSGKCDASFTGSSGDRLWGALDRLTDDQMEELDKYEQGYDRRAVEVSFDGGTLSAMLYVARESRIDPALRPYHWYKELVLAGARELGLPRGYIGSIEAVSSFPDPCREREDRNRAVLNERR